MQALLADAAAVKKTKTAVRSALASQLRVDFADIAVRGFGRGPTAAERDGRREDTCVRLAGKYSGGVCSLFHVFFTPSRRGEHKDQ